MPVSTTARAVFLLILPLLVPAQGARLRGAAHGAPATGRRLAAPAADDAGCTLDKSALALCTSAGGCCTRLGCQVGNAAMKHRNMTISSEV